MRRVLASLLAGSAVLSAQTPSPAPAAMPAFEVASVKRNASGSTNYRTSTLPANRTYVATNATVRQIILSVYRLRPYQLIGGPPWLDTDRFDISAKAPENATASDLLLMVHTLLADRFKLVTHRETREQSIYALVLARNDSRLGPQLRPSTSTCPAPPGAATLPAQPSQRPVCGITMSAAKGTLLGGGRTMAELAAALAMFAIDRPIVDRTGLSGRFEIDLEWAPQVLQSAAPDSGAATASDGPSIFTALTSQLGLRLQSTRGPVEVLVIGRVESPTPD
jgi:uncharacterized protein (TIGR03435 family)